MRGLAALLHHLELGALRSARPPVDRFRHPWLSPMPLTAAASSYLEQRRGGRADPRVAEALATPEQGDGFKRGDYGLGLFAHDASEAAIELLEHPVLRDAAAGSLLCLLDCAAPDGRVHRTELPHKVRDADPARPIIAQLAERTLLSLGAEGDSFAERHRVIPRAQAFLRWLELHTQGPHGLFLTTSAKQSGFDSDLLTAQLPDRSVEAPDINTFMVLEYQAAARLARREGDDRLGAELDEKAAELADRIERLLWWEDDRGGFYVGLGFEHGAGSLEAEILCTFDGDGRRRPLESWIGLLPLYAGIPSAERAEKLFRRLRDPAGYWGPRGLRTAPAWDPFFHQAARVMQWDHTRQRRGPVSNWSGPVWVLSSYYLAEGLARYGEAAAARSVALTMAEVMAEDLERTGKLHECWDDTGRGLWPHTGTFISWNVLAMTMLKRHAPELMAPETT